MNAITGTVALTPKADKQGKIIKIKVFWKTTKFWSDSDILDYQKSAQKIAERLVEEKYWDKDGKINSNHFTCEDFAIRVLCEYAEKNGLPVKLTTGVRSYRNMEEYNPDIHDKFPSNIYGFTDAVMLTYGARDMQRIGENTLIVRKVTDLRPGDILAQSNDNNGIAHHIQLVTATKNERIDIYQGNSGAGNVTSIFFRIFGKNPADPRDSSYTGKLIEQGFYTKINDDRWDYKNTTTNRTAEDFLKTFIQYRWNFKEFNK